MTKAIEIIELSLIGKPLVRAHLSFKLFFIFTRKTQLCLGKERDLCIPYDINEAVFLAGKNRVMMMTVMVVVLHVVGMTYYSGFLLQFSITFMQHRQRDMHSLFSISSYLSIISSTAR